MANRYNLGAAQFDIIINDAQALEAFAQTEAKARQGAGKIASAIKELETAYNASAKSAIAAMKASNDAFDAMEKKAAQAASAAAKSKAEFVDFGKSVIGAAATLVGLQVGLAAVSSALSESVSAALKAKQAQFELGVTFKNNSAEYTNYAKTLSAQTKFTTTEIQSSIVALGVLQQNYALTSNQLKTLTLISATYATKTGKDLEQSTRDIQAAIRGEGEAVEKLGLTLGRDFVKNAGLMTDAQKKLFYTLSDAERATIILAAAQKQAAEFQGVIAERAKSDLGIYDEWTKRVKELQINFGTLATKGLAPATVEATKVAQILGNAFTEENTVRVGKFFSAIGTGLLSVPVLGGVLEGIGAVASKVNPILDYIIARQEDVKKNMEEIKKAQGDTIPGADPGLPNGELRKSNAGQIAQETAALDAQAIAQQKVNVATTELKVALQANVKANTEANEQMQRALDNTIKIQNDAYDKIRAQTEADKHAAVQASEDKKNAAIKGIEQEEIAFTIAHTAIIAQLNKEKDDSIAASKDKKDAALASIDAEKEATQVAAKEQIRNLEIARDATLRNLDDSHDQVLRNLDVEKTAHTDAVDDQISLAQQAKEVEVRAAEDTKEAKIRAITEEAQKRADSYAKQLQQVSDNKDHEIKALEDVKKAQLDSIASQELALSKKRDRQDTNLEREKEQIDRSRDLADRALTEAEDRELKSLQARTEAGLRSIDERNKAEVLAINARDEAESRSLKARQTEQSRSLDDREKEELATLQVRDSTVEDSYNNEADAARAKSRSVIDGIDKEIDKLDEEHRHTLDGIDAEKRARLDEIDARINATNELGRSFENANKVTDLNQNLTIAERNGDLTGAAKIREQIRREQLRQEYETASLGLKNTRDSIAEELDAKKEALNNEYQDKKDALQREKELNKNTLDDFLATIKDRHDALIASLDDEKAAIKAKYDDQKQALQDQFTIEKQLQQDAINSEKQAIDDKFAHEKLAFQDAQAAEQTALKNRYDSLKKTIDDSRYIEDQAYELRIEKIKSQRKVEDEAFDARKKKINDTFDDEKNRVNDNADNTTRKLKEEAEETKRTFDKQKEVVGDAYDEEKRRIDDIYDNPVSGILARLRDQRVAVEREYKARTDAINLAYDAEKQQIHDTYDSEATGAIPAIKRAVDAAVIEYGHRRDEVEKVYQNEIKNIHDVYDDPVNGLFKKQEDMASEAKRIYAARKVAVNEAYQAEKDSIYAVYDDPLHGLIARQAAAHKGVIDALNAQKTRWQQWATDTNSEINKVLGGPLKNLEQIIHDLEAKGYLNPGQVKPPSQQPEPKGAGAGGNTGGGSAPSPFSVAFGFNQPYTHPFNPAIPNHRGVDLTLPGKDNGKGSTYGAFSDATVVQFFDNDPNGGDGILTQRDADGLYEYYGHNQSRLVTPGNKVKRGQALGVLGDTGTKGFPHLHYEVRRNPGGDSQGNLINPYPFMNGLNNTFTGANQGTDLEQEYVFYPFGPNGPPLVLKLRDISTGDWAQKALQAAQQQGFSDPPLFERQMKHESANYNPKVISGEKRSTAGAIGIAQFMESTAKALGINPFNPQESLFGAAKYMHYLENRYGSTRNALWAYNAGEGNFMSSIMHDETRDYLRIIQGYKDGKMIMNPTLMLDTVTGEMGMAGETGQPERLLGVAATAGYGESRSSGPMQVVKVQTVLGNNVIQDIVIKGLKLAISTGSLYNIPGIAIS